MPTHDARNVMKRSPIRSDGNPNPKKKNVRYNSEKGFDRVNNHVKSLGHSLVDNLESWLKNRYNAQSKPPVLCGKCGRRRESANINSIMKFCSIGCGCDQFTWDSKIGFERYQNKVEDVLEHTMVDTLESWLKNKYNSKSKPPVLCGKCGRRCEKASVFNILSGQGIGCLCTTRPWSTEVGYDKIKPRVEELGHTLAVTLEYWMKQEYTVFSKVPIKCGPCGAIRKSRIHDMMHGHDIQCNHINSTSGRKRLEDMLQQHCSQHALVETEEEWLKADYTMHSKVAVWCGICHAVWSSSNIGNLMHGDDLGCHKKYFSQQGRQRFIQILDDMGNGDQLMMSEAEWMASNINHTSLVKIKCGICNKITFNRIQGIMGGISLACEIYKFRWCTLEGREKLVEMLLGIGGGHTVVDSESEWVAANYGAFSTPPIQCGFCASICSAKSLHTLDTSENPSIGCHNCTQPRGVSKIGCRWIDQMEELDHNSIQHIH